MKSFDNSRASLILAIVLFYLFPIVLLSGYTMGFIATEMRWKLFSVGLLSGTIGSCILFIVIYRWEQNLRQRLVSALRSSQNIVEHPDPEKEQELQRLLNEKLIKDALAPLQSKHDKMKVDISLKDEELMQALEERKGLQSQILMIRGELDSYRDKMQIQLLQEQQQNLEHQKVIKEQQTLIGTLQQQISSLEIKEKELSYEIKTLVNLSNFEIVEKETPPKKQPVDTFALKSHESISRQLAHFVDIAASMASVQNIQGVPSHLNDLATDNYRLELRRLCENLNMESRYVMLLHSPRENRILFANDHVKTVLGWTPEKFIQQFPDIVLKGIEDWNKEMDVITANREGFCAINARSQMNQSIAMNCHLRAISSGTFRNHVIVLMCSSVL